MKRTDAGPGFVNAVSDLYPGLIGRAKETIEASEREYEGKGAGDGEGFLWEHTVHVASLAHKLALAEGLDPVLPVVAALFHDAGKFSGGAYHGGDRAEEEGASALAALALEREGARASEVAKLRNALSSLYREKARRNAVAAVVHDADFLSKFGYLGVAGFFLKSALRGKNLVAAVMSSLSKELTYANALPRNMRTEAGRKAALKRSRDSLRFFRALLRELEETRRTGFRVRKMPFVVPGSPGKPIDVLLVVPAACESCGGRWMHELSLEKGVKCRTLEARLRCAGCGGRYEMAFCLPELAGPRGRRG